MFENTGIALIFIVFAIVFWFCFDSVVKRIKFVRRVNDIPGPTSYPLIGTAYHLLGVDLRDIPRLLYENQLNFPGISRSWLGPIAQIDIRRAEYVEIVLRSTKHYLEKAFTYKFIWPWLGNGLLTSSGEHWHLHRKIITPAFHFSILEGFCDIFADKSNILVNKLEKHAGTGRPIDIYPFITKAALDIICEAAMGTEINAQANEDNDYVRAVYETSELVLRRLIKPWLHPDWLYAMSSDGRKFVKSLGILHSFTERVIKQRRMERKYNKNDHKKKRLAFLDLLLETNESEHHELTNTELREEVDTFMFEGHDTTAAGIAWALFLLGHNPDIQKQVHHELDGIFGKSDRSATIEDLNDMVLLDRVIKETLRLYPPVPVIGRTADIDVHLDDYVIPAGSNIAIEIVHLHLDERFYPEPKKFDPDRFLPDPVNDRHPFAYLPFSAGARNCIGQKFAMLEEKVVLSTILRKFQLEAVGKQEDIRVVYELIYRPSDGIHLMLQKRH